MAIKKESFQCYNMMLDQIASKPVKVGEKSHLSPSTNRSKEFGGLLAGIWH